MKHFVDLKSHEISYLEKILERSLTIKKNPSKFRDAINGKNMYMLFQKTSTRTALSFALAMEELGGTYFLQNWQDSNFCIGEIEDEVRYVGCNSNIIMARLKKSEDIHEMAKHSLVPVINGCCNKDHPSQVMADMLTIKELFGTYNVKLLYIGVRNNVVNSLMAALPRLGGKLSIITPIINEPSIDNEVYEMAMKTGNFTDYDYTKLTEKDLKDIVRDVDIVYTDSWVDMEFFTNKEFEKEKNERIAKMLPFQLNSKLLEGSKARVMHDMPMHPGYEITREVIEAHKDIILLQAENRRHAEKGIIITLLEDDNIRALFNE